MKSTSIAISLDMRRARQDGTFPLILRLTHKTKTTSIRTGIYLRESDWDQEARVVKKSYSGVTNVTRLNNEIQKKKAEALDNILKLEERSKKTPFTVVEVKGHIAPTLTSQSFYEYADKLIKDLRKAERLGTARSYEGVVNVLKTFNKGKPFTKNKGGDPQGKTRTKDKIEMTPSTHLRFDEINYAFLMRFQTYHLASGNELNGLAVYMRTIRSIYNQAIKSGVADKALYPFDDYKIKTSPTKKRALDSEYITAIVNLSLSQDHPCFEARKYFLASYMMYGMNFADMAFLKKSDVLNNRIYYRRRKTSKLYDIRIIDSLSKTLEYFMARNPSSVYVFPIIKRETSILQARDVQWARKRYNKKLKLLAELCGIEQNLTSYVSRHSFATQAIRQSVPVNAISTMLGHSSLKTTEIYLKSLPSNILDDYNSLIIGEG
ncbi:MAG: site-specific integrase [Sphingobacteriales bacterium]|nr:MAG: site-specific integrase [Sphingobacteriales bacterium]